MVQQSSSCLRSIGAARRSTALYGAAPCGAARRWIIMLVNVHNESSNAPYGAVRRWFCCSNRSRFDFAVWCRAAQRRTARSVNAAPILHAFDYGVYAPYGEVRRSKELCGAVRHAVWMPLNTVVKAKIKVNGKRQILGTWSPQTLWVSSSKSNASQRLIKIQNLCITEDNKWEKMT